MSWFVKIPCPFCGSSHTPVHMEAPTARNWEGPAESHRHSLNRFPGTNNYPRKVYGYCPVHQRGWADFRVLRG